MDDPSGCRGDYLPYYAPVAPPSDPHVLGVNAFLHVKESLFCPGEEYEPAPLPIASPAPSQAPSTSAAPTSTPTLSTIQISQVKGLRAFYSAVKMARQSQYHNWFPNGEALYPSNYCSWTGVECNDDGYVTSIQLLNMGLSGSLPASSLSGLKRLQRLKLVGNAIKGPLPEVSSLRQLLQLELAVNDFTGEHFFSAGPTPLHIIFNRISSPCSHLTYHFAILTITSRYHSQCSRQLQETQTNSSSRQRFRRHHSRVSLLPEGDSQFH